MKKDYSLDVLVSHPYVTRSMVDKASENLQIKGYNKINYHLIDEKLANCAGYASSPSKDYSRSLLQNEADKEDRICIISYDRLKNFSTEDIFRGRVFSLGSNVDYLDLIAQTIGYVSRGQK
ncbi:MAG: hypothetical protein ACQESF_06360 [Nanobdellota archaeon]